MSPSRTQKVLAELRRSALFRSVVAQESNLGWPIPRLRSREGETGVYLTVPAFPTRPCEGGGLLLFAPHARVTLAWPSGRVVEFHDHSFDNPWPQAVDPNRPIGGFPHPGLPHDTAAYQRLRAGAYGYYDELLDLMDAGGTVPAPWWDRFSAQLGPLVEPGLLPFYRVLGPKFFARIVPDDQAHREG